MGSDVGTDRTAVILPSPIDEGAAVASDRAATPPTSPHLVKIVVLRQMEYSPEQAGVPLAEYVE